MDEFEDLVAQEWEDLEDEGKLGLGLGFRIVSWLWSTNWSKSQQLTKSQL